MNFITQSMIFSFLIIGCMQSARAMTAPRAFRPAYRPMTPPGQINVPNIHQRCFAPIKPVVKNNRVPSPVPLDWDK
ncbi:hypothetical protein KAZ82_01020 [Candidatus Babeliales bacterium]|nr:hypothetical protein [Candidatus Babeliales bacterium]